MGDISEGDTAFVIINMTDLANYFNYTEIGYYDEGWGVPFPYTPWFIQGDGDEPDGKTSPAFSADGSYLAVVDVLKNTEIWETDNWTLVEQIPNELYSGYPHSSITGIGSLSFSYDGSILAIGTTSYPDPPREDDDPPKLDIIRIISTTDWSELNQLSGSNTTAAMQSLSFSDDDSMLLSGSFSGAVRIWETSAWSTVQLLTNSTSDVAENCGNATNSNYSLGCWNRAVFSPNSSTIVVDSWNNRISVWEVDSDGDGVSDNTDMCPETEQGWSANINGCALNQLDSDGDGVSDDIDELPFDSTETMDSDGDGIGDNADNDDDNDGLLDNQEDSNSNGVVDAWETDPMNPDTDGDGSDDFYDAFPLDANEQFDFDFDGIGDNADNDDDNDGYNDSSDMFPYDQSEWLDEDSDNIGDNEDTDDDNDGFSDEAESACNTDSNNPESIPIDTDVDGVCDWVDGDDDNDGFTDEIDIWPRDKCAALDTDSDGMPDSVIDDCQTNLTADDDDDGDSVLDVDDFCSPGETGWISGATLGTDHDGDGCRDDGEDTDDDNDGVNDSEDGCPRGITGAAFNAIFDTDGDGCLESEDSDDDNDGVSDINDDFPLDPSETTDTDGDGIGDNADTDDDGDGWSDHEETYECDTNPLDENSIPTDTDNDLECDKSDTDDDNDGLLDIEELLIGTDPLSEDSDSDGVRDSEDIFPLDSTEWVDTDGDGTGDNSDAFPSIARYQTYGGIALELSAVLIIVIIALLVLRMRGGGESEEDSPEPNNTDPMEDYVQQLIAQGYPEETARQNAQQHAEHFQK
jgi:hypothetical protein